MLQISGVVHGGQQPVSNATIQLYAANTATDKGASALIPMGTVTTGSDGSFTITGLYTCPSSNPMVYLLSTGGNPGLGGSVNNPDIALMAAIGECSTLLTTPFVVINELTTVAAVEALAPFMADATHIGSSASDLNSVAGPFAQAAGNIPVGTGQFGGTSLSVIVLQWNTLANILAACVNTSGSSSGPCGQLPGGADTITAALQMVKSPTSNASTLYGLITGTPPFQPYFTGVPSDLTVTVGYPLPPNIHAASQDSNGQIWVYTGGYSYTPPPSGSPPFTQGTSTDLEGVITVYDNNLNPLTPTISPGTGGLFFAASMAGDASGNVFAVNANNTVSKYGSSFSAISPSGTPGSGGWYTNISPGTFNETGSGNFYAENPAQVGPIRVDSTGTIWGNAPYSFTPGAPCYFEMSSAGTPSTPTGGNFCATLGSFDFGAPEPDGSGNAWFYGSAIAKVDSLGNLAATAPTSTGCFNASTLVSEQRTSNIAYDHVSNQLWGYSETGAGAISDAGVAVFCDVSPTLPVTPTTTSSSTTPGDAFTGNSQLISSAVLDGAGNLWFITNGVSATGTVVSYSTTSKTYTFTGTVTYSSYLGEISPNGTVLKKNLQPSGLGVNGSANVANATFGPAVGGASLLWVDKFGNIWAFDSLSSRVIKIAGTGAVANRVNY